MNKLVSYIRAAFVWAAAVSLASKHNSKSALAKLDSIAPIYSGKRVRYHILRGFLEFSNELFFDSIKNFQIGRELLEKSNSYTKEEKSYLNCYISIYGNLSQSYIDSTGKAPFPPANYTNVDLIKVRKFIKSQFPLVHHPEWKNLRNR